MANPAPYYPQAGQNGSYSYANPLGTQQGSAGGVPIQTLGAGMSSLATALINGYFDKQQQQNQNAPMQLQGGQQPNFMSAIFGTAPPNPNIPDPSVAGIY